jgi:hypothetical protein
VKHKGPTPSPQGKPFEFYNPPQNVERSWSVEPTTIFRFLYEKKTYYQQWVDYLWNIFDDIAKPFIQKMDI